MVHARDIQPQKKCGVACIATPQMDYSRIKSHANAILGLLRFSALYCRYWGNMTANTGINYNYDPDAPPTIYGYDVSMEVTTNFFWTGAALSPF